MAPRRACAVYTLRFDGFDSVSAPPKGGEMLTKPIVFAKSESPNQLHINFATSAVGSMKVELQDANGKPIDNFTGDNCDEIYGDSNDRVVTWKGNADISQFADQPIRLRFMMRDADLYSLQVAPATAKKAN